MNVSLDLSKAQLSKLRNGHGIRITPKMVGSGMDLIVDPMNFNNMNKKLERGKGVILKMGSNELDMNKMEGTGLFAGAGNKSGKINRFKKATRWRDFAGDTVDRGLDLGKKGVSLYQQATSPVKKLFGGEMDMEGGNIFNTIKGAYNKNVKNTKAGEALRGVARKGLSTGFDKGTQLLDSNKFTKPIATIGRNQKGAIVDRAMQMSGLGLRMAQGRGMRMGSGMCMGCGMNDKFLFADQAL